MDNKGYRKFLIKFTASALVFALLVGLFMYLVDPLQMYRKSTFYAPLYSSQERYQNAGLARSYEYDTIILGSSMTQNFVPSYVEEVMGGSVMKLSIEGSTAMEQHAVGKVALGTGQVKKVIWGLDYFAMRQDVDAVSENMPMYMYDNNPFNDYEYLFNISNIKHAWRALTSSEDEYRAFRNLDTLRNWDKSAKYSKEKVLETWEKARIKEQNYGKNEFSLDNVKAVFDKYVLSLIKEHPETEFTFYYPPYTILRQQVWAETNPVRAENQYAMKKYMFDQFSKYPNVKVYDFQEDTSITYDLAQYKDLSHHSQAINELIIREIAKGKNLVTADNVDKFNEELESQLAHLAVDMESGAFSLFVYVDGEEVEFSVPAQVREGRILVPIKELAAALGAEFGFDGTSVVKLRKGDITAALTKGSSKMTVQTGEDAANAKTIDLGYSMQNLSGSMMVAIEPVAEVFAKSLEVTEPEQYVKDIRIETDSAE
ncbi:copper amine oxidase N-terminal domain-containing protein [Saccharibacillus alkalitolerans]|uniref:Copper amine oxidase N-terminal domain-containing protein n=1 Tax=Saccharibacillus alkalitolerans TaxID=2705290 RepID=A0ABX0F8I2_9BACL|nr:copper amine oxidase N-terminal domain-containing protein [Saccharibacillus alkalitolerans]NGZ76215.1 copper amine oxidase N-terminal domain-containing protein [Saccharibacillus alkalitolerans]